VTQLESSGPIYTPEGKNEIDLRGLLEMSNRSSRRFLDDAIVAGLHRVDIIPRKRDRCTEERIGEFLKTYPHVRSSDSVSGTKAALESRR